MDMRPPRAMPPAAAWCSPHGATVSSAPASDSSEPAGARRWAPVHGRPLVVLISRAADSIQFNGLKRGIRFTRVESNFNSLLICRS